MLSQEIRSEEIIKAIENIPRKKLNKKVEKLIDKPKKTSKELNKIIENLSKKEISEGIRLYGGAEVFIGALLYYMATQLILAKKGFEVGLAAAASSTAFFGTGNLCHSVAEAFNSEFIDSVAEGFDTLGMVSETISETGFELFTIGWDNLDICDALEKLVHIVSIISF